MLRHLKLITLTLVFGATPALGQGVTTSSKGGSVSLGSSVAIAAAHDSLAAQFRRLAEAATASKASSSDRDALVRLVRGKITPLLTQEVIHLFPVFDSIIGGGYAVPATLFDLDGVSYLVKELERTAASGDRSAFHTRAYALSIALEGYFTKVELLVLPVLKERLGEAALSLRSTQ